MEATEFKIPASSANLGPGFDSIGLALEKFLYIKAEKSDWWEMIFERESLRVLPSDETNLCIRTAVNTAGKYQQEMPQLKITMDSEIPLTHGMGSSASAIVAGIELADRFCDLNLSEFEKVKRATELEGHPDNVGPSVTGGFFVGHYKDDELFYYNYNLKSLSVIVSIPVYEIDTKEARAALPLSYIKQDAVDQNAINNVLLMALINQDYKAMGQLMMRDRLHEPYRRHLIKEYDEIRAMTLSHGAYATVISGAGPTLLTLCDEADAGDIMDALSAIPDCVHEAINIYTKS